ncbi:peptidylprolyl isomerase [Sulfurimonas sp. HSL-1656]|uniref:peptidylprolyl isomerase n=1 Tax=Thiomicrolovo subterrani TaxID=3131934 RepID=UPI0031F89CE4
MRKFFGFFILCVAAAALFGAADKHPHVLLKTTQGTIELEIRDDLAPLAAENFLTHVKEGYYDGIIFHRIIKGFMIQGGDPTGTGRGGESIWHRPFKNEYAPNVVFDKPGILAMANAGRNTNGSQFFITTAAAPWLNGGYTIFGYVVKGMDVVYKLEGVRTGRQDRPLESQTILKASVAK